MRNVGVRAPYVYSGRFRGLPLAVAGSRLDDYRAYVGSENAEFIIPITRDLESVVEPGDVLVYAKDVDRASVADSFTLGHEHTGLVVKDAKGFWVAESQYGVNQRVDNRAPAHVFRLKADYPDRTKVLEKVNRIGIFLGMPAARGGHPDFYQYDDDRLTHIPDDVRSLKAMMDTGRCTSRLSLYCSEFVALVHAASGIEPMPRMYSMMVAVNDLERAIRSANSGQYLGVETGTKEWRAIVNATVDRFISGNPALLAWAGVSKEEDLKQAKETLKLLLCAKPGRERERVLSENPFFSKEKGEIIAPSDFFVEPYVSEGKYCYVGTYVADQWGPEKTAGPANVLPKALEMAAPWLARPGALGL
ncbi:MAG TPA: hypothetical protein VNI01_16615 [Elusimicrobiota bacterium]|nr:hypothetical protein [Elusimicrobiota bacterium]